MTSGRDSTPPLEREAELSRVERLLHEAQAGAGRLALIEGAPGIGKTRLLEDACRRAGEHQLTVLSARGSERERSFGFGVVHQLLDPVVTSDTPRGRAELMTGAAGLAERLFEAVPEVESSDDASYPVLHGLYWLTANLADRAPLFIAVDDAQWIDRPSGRFLEYLSRRLEGMPVAIAVAARARRRESEADALYSIGSHPVERMYLRPLSLDGVAKLVEVYLGSAPAEDLARACLEATGGNPFLLHELLQELRTAKRTGPHADPGSIRRLGPRSVSAAALGRVGQVPGATELARSVATLGDGAGLAEVAAVTNVDRGEASRIADTLAEAAILEPERPLRFVHPLVRSAVYRDIPPARRAELHAHAARVLGKAGASPEAVAAHLLEADARGDCEVVETLRRAARKSRARGAPEPAIDYLRRALAEPPSDDTRSDVLCELGSVLATVGSADAVPLLQEAFELSRGPEPRAGVALELADALQITGQLPVAVDLLETALDELPDEAHLAARVESRLLPLASTGASARRRLDRRLVSAAQRLRRLPEQRARVLRASLAFDRATGPDASAESAAELARQALADGQLIDEERPDSVFCLGATNALFLSGRHAEAEHALTALAEKAQATGSARGFTLFSSMRSWCRYLRGALGGAEADARAFLELAGEASWKLLDPLAAAVLSAVLVERGDLEEARRAVAPFEPLREHDDLGFVQLLHVSEARIRLASGDARGALTALAPCRRFEAAWGPNAGIACAVPWRSTAALAQLALGERLEALSVAEDEVSLARQFGAPRPLGVALCALGRVEERAAGIGLLEEAVAVLATADACVEHARALIELGAALRRLGKRSEAREPLEAGMDLAHRSGAAAVAANARQELLVVGARPRRLATSGAEALTASERRIAKLAAEGMTNREIAQSLFVTLPTVEGHLTHAFRKLAVESRQELAGAMRPAPPVGVA